MNLRRLSKLKLDEGWEHNLLAGFHNSRNWRKNCFAELLILLEHKVSDARRMQMSRAESLAPECRALPVYIAVITLKRHKEPSVSEIQQILYRQHVK
jgi:hypothetical protein